MVGAKRGSGCWGWGLELKRLAPDIGVGVSTIL